MLIRAFLKCFSTTHRSMLVLFREPWSGKTFSCQCRNFGKKRSVITLGTGNIYILLAHCWLSELSQWLPLYIFFLQTYMALAKGGLVDGHVLVLPIGHHQSTVSAPEEIMDEIQQLVSSYAKFKKKNMSWNISDPSFCFIKLYLRCLLLGMPSACRAATKILQLCLWPIFLLCPM